MKRFLVLVWLNCIITCLNDDELRLCLKPDVQKRSKLWIYSYWNFEIQRQGCCCIYKGTVKFSYINYDQIVQNLKNLPGAIRVPKKFSFCRQISHLCQHNITFLQSESSLFRVEGLAPFRI